MADERELRVDLNVTGADEAATVLDDVADAAERVEDVGDVAVAVDVDTTDAARDVTKLDGDLDELERRKVTPSVDLVVDDDSIRRARAKVDDLGNAGGSAGHKFGSNFASETGAVFNQEAAGLAGDFSGAFETGLAAAGIDEALGGMIAGGVGIGIVALTTLWAQFSEKAEEARRKLEAATALQRSLAAGEVLEAGRKFQEDFGDLITRAERSGIGTDSIVAFLQGLDAPEVTEWIEQVREANAQTLSFGGRLSESAKAAGDLADDLAGVKTAGTDAAEGIAASDARMIVFLKNQKASTDEWIEFARDAGPAAKRAVSDYLVEVEKIPPNVRTEFEAAIAAGDVAAVDKILDDLAATREASIRVSAEYANQLARDLLSGKITKGSVVYVPGVPTTQVLNFTVNAGLGTDAFAVQQAIVSAARQAARLNQGARR